MKSSVVPAPAGAGSLQRSVLGELSALALSFGTFSLQAQTQPRKISGEVVRLDGPKLEVRAAAPAV